MKHKKIYELFYQIMTNSNELIDVCDIPIEVQLAMYNANIRFILSFVAINLKGSHRQIATKMGIKHHVVRFIRDKVKAKNND